MTGSLPSPLGGAAPVEVLLPRSPLVRVVAQARFSRVLKIDSQDGMVAFQEEIRSEYPLLEQVAAQQLQVDFSSGLPNVRPVTSTLWRFSDANRGWLLSFASDVITLETRRYEGRTNFLGRWAAALASLERIFTPSLAVRLGVRYINRIDGESLLDLAEWVRPGLIGVAEPQLRDHVTQALSEAMITIEEGSLQLRWGILPANVTYDPNLLAAVPNSSWILDIDVSSTGQRPFSGVDLTSAFQALTNRAYSVFRYAVTDAGLDHFGAQS
jgi:uncharacterized protein (TIGR04255 family)